MNYRRKMQTFIIHHSSLIICFPSALPPPSSPISAPSSASRSMHGRHRTHVFQGRSRCGLAGGGNSLPLSLGEGPGEGSRNSLPLLGEGPGERPRHPIGRRMSRSLWKPVEGRPVQVIRQAGRSSAPPFVRRMPQWTPIKVFSTGVGLKIGDADPHWQIVAWQRQSTGASSRGPAVAEFSAVTRHLPAE